MKQCSGSHSRSFYLYDRIEYIPTLSVAKVFMVKWTGNNKRGLCHSRHSVHFCWLAHAQWFSEWRFSLCFPVYSLGMFTVEVTEQSFKKPSLVADGLLTFIGCCLGANHLTHLHPHLFQFSQPCLPLGWSRTEACNVCTAWKTHTFSMAFWANL